MKCSILLLLLTCVWAIAVPKNGNEDDQDNGIHVSAGQSIQAAIDKASPGSTVVVNAGTYNERLTISKDGLTLVGRGAVLQGPAEGFANTCSDLAGPDTQAGICVTGRGVNLANFVVEHRKVLSVDKYVEGVTVNGMEVDGFDLNIAVVGARDAHVLSNTLKAGTAYGFLSDGSIDTLTRDNTITFPSTGLGSIGLCNDNKAGAEIVANHVSGYAFALCVQTDYAQIYNNDITNNCVGAYVDPHITGANIFGNHFSTANPFCGPGGGAGVFLSGAVSTTVIENSIDGMQPGAGVVIVDDACTEMALGCLAAPGVLVQARNNIVKQNTFSNNALDVFENTTATNNLVIQNHCTSSVPQGLCT